MNDDQYLKSFIKDYTSKKKVKYLFFWGHQPAQKSIIDQTCLSQWYTAPFTLNAVRYTTAEHYMMAQKAKLFNDHDMFQQIIQCNHPKQAKQLGRLVKNYNENTWIQHRFNIIIQGNTAKFSQHKTLTEYLINTNKRTLVEASPYDRIWGVGLAANNPKVENPLQWKGLNLLGFALMQVRDQLLK